MKTVLKKILALSFYKILNATPYYLYSYWTEESFLTDKVNLSSKDISHFLTALGKDLVSIELFFKNWIEQNNTKGVAMFDITSLSSYGTKNEFLDRGYNRDGEVLEQINVGMLSKKINSIGHMPLAYKIYPGSINDVVTIENMSKFIESYSLSADIFVMDKGFYSEKNLNIISSKPLSFMLPMSFSTKKSIEIIDQVFKQAHSSQSVFELNDELYSHVETTKDVGKFTYRAHVFLDKNLRLNQESIFLKKIIELENKFRASDIDDLKGVEDFFQMFKSKRKFFLITKDFKLKRNLEEIDRGMKRFGFMIILTNKQTKP